MGNINFRHRSKTARQEAGRRGGLTTQKKRRSVLPHMPEFFKQWLMGLSDEQAEALWLYVDGTVHSENEIINVVCESHPAVVKKHCTEEN